MRVGLHEAIVVLKGPVLSRPTLITYDTAAQYMQRWNGPGEGARLSFPVGQTQHITGL